MVTKKFHVHRFLSLLLLAALVAGACQVFSPQPATPQPGITPAPATEAAPAGTVVPVGPAETEDPLPVPEMEAAPLPAFAKFTEPQVQAEAAVKQEPIAADLSNVHNPFLLSQAQLERLGQDGIVVTPGSEKEFFTVYEKARYANVPIFVTSDSLLHSYHLLFDKLLRTAEVEHFIPLLKELNAALLATVSEQYQALKGTDWEEPARRTVAFVGVASRLLDPQIAVPDYAEELVGAELALIEKAGGIQHSPLFPYLEFGEDYTQYIPRGHYTRSDALKAYFKSMMWYGRMTFRLKPKDPEAGRAETRSALLLVQALRASQVDDKPALEAWADLYSPTVFFVGRSDDLTASQYIPVIDAVYGAGPSLETIADDSKLDTFIEAANQLPPPRILGMVISDQDDEEAETKGLRFMGQRFVPDAYIFRQLIYRNVGANETTGDPRRGLPKGLDLMAAMGSERAYAILEEAGDTGHANYPQQMDKVQQWLSSLSVDEWTETLYNAWIYSFFPLIDVPGEGYPAFMRSGAWLDKQLNTALGSWAELKHDTILYAKQVYAEMGGGPPPPEPVPPKGYVEPVPGFFARLTALTAMTREGLESRGLLSEVDAANLQRLEELSRAFQAMAEKELRGEALTQEESDLIRFYGGDLEHLVMAAADTDNADEMGDKYMDEEPQVAVVADVATDPDPDGEGTPNPVVLEEAVGRVDEIHAVVPVILDDGSVQLQVAKGGVFSYYEFEWPADDRLTDEKWRTMLEEGKAPELPGWTASFRTDQGAYTDLQLGVQSFQLNLRNLMWEPAMYDPANYEAGMAPFGPEMEPFQAEANELRAAQEYVGKQLISVQFDSYDLQSEDRALVTVRETWEDKRYQGEFPDFDRPVIAQRGPYTVRINYTLERNPEQGVLPWIVTKVDYLDPLPEWQAP